LRVLGRFQLTSPTIRARQKTFDMAKPTSEICSAVTCAVGTRPTMQALGVRGAITAPSLSRCERNEECDDEENNLHGLRMIILKEYSTLIGM